MKIVVMVKEVPDTYGDRKLDLETGLVDRAAGESVLDEIGERAIEVALSYADDHPDTEIVVLTVGPESAVDALRKGLAMGATSAVHVLDDALVGADLGLTAHALAAAARRIGFDVIVCGNLSTDGTGGVMAAMVGELLGAATATNLTSVTLSEDGVTGVRATGSGTADISTPLPAVVSISEALPEARLASLKGVMAAKKKPVETWTLADLGVVDSPERPQSIVVAVSERPAREAGVKIVDEGDAGSRLAEFLVSNKLV